MHMNIVANNNLITYAGDNTALGGACTAANDPYTNMIDQPCLARTRRRLWDYRHR